MLSARGNVVRLVQAPGIDHEHIAHRLIEDMLGDGPTSASSNSLVPQYICGNRFPPYMDPRR